MKKRNSTAKFKTLLKLGFNITDHPKVLHERMKKKKWTRFKNAVPRKTTEYGTLLLAKQRLKYFYGNIKERQIINLYKNSKILKGNNGINFLKLLEKRLDTVLFRSRFGNSYEDVRQLILHGHILVNGTTVKTPSYQLESNDSITVNDKSFSFVQGKVLRSLEGYLNSSSSTSIKSSLDNISLSKKYKLLMCPDYIEVNYNILEVLFIENPSIDNLQYPFPIDLKRIIQYYEYQRKI